MNLSSKAIQQYIALGFLGVAGLMWLYKGDNTNAAWALGALIGYAFKNGVINKVIKET